MSTNLNYDGQIYFNESDIPVGKEDLNFEGIFESDESHPVEIESLNAEIIQSVIYTRKLASWKDLTTPPKTRMKCVKTCRVGPIKTCCGWKVQYKWYYRTATLIVSTKIPKDIKKEVEDCIKTAIVASAITAIVSGGTAAIAAAEKAFYGCLLTKLGDDLVNVKIDLRGTWGDWS